MKEYLKIGDVFGCSEVTTQKLVGDAYELRADGYGHICVVNTEFRADLIANTINSHDELVAEVERLNLQVEDLLRCVDIAVASGHLSPIYGARKKYITD